MTKLTLEEATSLMHSYGIKCNMIQVEKWLKEGRIKGKENDGIYAINENEIYEFLEDYRWEGTAYEKGIDDKTKINRLQEEIYEFRLKIEELESEKRELQKQLATFGVMPF
jgi:predicted RNase H-like nuclease (RuvC/YqgF family)